MYLTVYLFVFLTFWGLDEFGILEAVALLDGEDKRLPQLLDDRSEACHIPPGGGQLAWLHQLTGNHELILIQLKDAPYKKLN